MASGTAAAARYVMEISWTDTFPLPIFLCSSLFLSVFLSHRVSPSSFRSLPTILRHPLFLVPFFGSATIPTSLVRLMFLNRLAISMISAGVVFFAFFSKGDYETSGTHMPLISVTARKHAGVLSVHQAATLTTEAHIFLIHIEYSFFPLVKI